MPLEQVKFTHLVHWLQWTSIIIKHTATAFTKTDEYLHMGLLSLWIMLLPAPLRMDPDDVSLLSHYSAQLSFWVQNSLYSKSNTLLCYFLWNSLVLLCTPSPKSYWLNKIVDWPLKIQLRYQLGENILKNEVLFYKGNTCFELLSNISPMCILTGTGSKNGNGTGSFTIAFYNPLT